MPEKRKRCTGRDSASRGEISLPLLATEHGPSGAVRKSRSGRRRAVVLAIVQIVLAAHVIMWLLSKRYGWFDGYTLTPIEPSESIEFVSYGVVNAGLIFFVLALLATLVLGRWFCGWGCHVVLLQDLCGWIMRKIGIRPKPFRSRLLIYVPLLMALYMFVWPAVFRWGWLPLDAKLFASLGPEHWIVASERAVAAFFGIPLGHHPPAWKLTSHLSTDDFWRTFAGVWVAIPFLAVCGFATVYFLGAKGFCTYGCPYGGFFAPIDRLAPMRIRVNDDCEHCGHCTAVCTSNVRVHEEVREYGMVVDPGCMKCLDCVSVCPNDALSVGWGRPSVAKGAPRNAKPKRKYDLTWPEEIAFSAVFLTALVCSRGVYNMVPFLMAAGIAGCVTFITWKAWRLFRDPSVNLHRFTLKQKGTWQASGRVYCGLAAAVCLLVVHSGVVRVAYTVGERGFARVEIPVGDVLAGAPVPDDARRHAERGLAGYRLASPITEGGIGLMVPWHFTWQSRIDLNRWYLAYLLGELADAEAVARRTIERRGNSSDRTQQLVLVLLSAQKFDDAVEACRARLAADPDDLQTLGWLALVLRDKGPLEAAVPVMRDIVRLAPGDLLSRDSLIVTLMRLDRHDDARVALDDALEVFPEHPRLLQLRGQMP